MWAGSRKPAFQGYLLSPTVRKWLSERIRDVNQKKSEPQILTDSADFTDGNLSNPHNLRQSAVQILSRKHQNMKIRFLIGSDKKRVPPNFGFPNVPFLYVLCGKTFFLMRFQKKIHHPDFQRKFNVTEKFLKCTHSPFLSVIRVDFSIPPDPRWRQSVQSKKSGSVCGSNTQSETSEHGL